MKLDHSNNNINSNWCSTQLKLQSHITPPVKEFPAWQELYAAAAFGYQAGKSTETNLYELVYKKFSYFKDSEWPP